MVRQHRRGITGAPTPAVGGSGRLLAAKLTPPRLPAAFVVRRRLLDRLDRGMAGDVTVICAGPGSGKTSLAASWAAGDTPGPVAWLSLDPYDNDLVGFWTYLLAALRSAGCPVERRHPRSPVGEKFVRRVARTIAGLPGPVVLVLDDLHEIEHPQVLRSLMFLLRHPMPRLRLLVTSRDERAAPLLRQRAGRRSVEIRAGELRFRADEAADLLARHGLRPAPAELDVLVDRTEGWATALVLAANLLTERGATAGLQEFSGTERSVAEYLTSEVLADLPPQTAGFLRRTSVVDRICGELADALTGGTHGGRTLELLARSNALVSPVDGEPGWFRYHGLLTDLLRHQMRLETPGLVEDLHRRAAHWFAARDDAFTAIRHAVAARDWRLVGDLVVTRAGPRIVSADRARLVGLLSQVPEQEFATTAGLEICSALLAFERGDYDAMGNRVARARVLTGSEADSLHRPIEIVAYALEAAHAREAGDMATLVETAGNGLKLLAEVSPAQLFSAEEWRAIALNNAGVGLFWMGRSGVAETHLRSGMAAAEATGIGLTQINAASHLALLEADQGNLHEAYGHARAGLDLARERGWGTALQAVAAYVALGLVHLQWNQLADAAAILGEGLAAQRTDPEPVQLSAVRVAQLRVLLARGEIDAARLVLERLRRDADLARTPLVLGRWLTVAEAELALSAGDPGEVLGRIDGSARIEDVIPRMRLCVARAHLALGAPLAAEAALATLQRSAPDLGIAVETWLITALIQDALRRSTGAIEALGRAVALAEPQNIRRPFLGIEGARVAGLLERSQWLAPGRSGFVADLLAVSAAARPQPVPGPEAEEITDRELDVLRYLPTMLRNQDIAAEMYVSVNTVRAHLRSLYRKLGVSHRREAVDRAREQGLL
jgi:LuxR family maltose regulon positive regulatory protein